jgi:hypothetical protein
MPKELRDLLAALYNAEATETPACRACLDELSAFIDAELDGENAPVRFPKVVEHLASCEACQQEYREMKQLLALERTGELVEPPVASSFDFSYLDSVPDPDPDLYQMSVRGGFAWFERGTDRLRQLRIFLATWETGQTATPALSGLMRVEGEEVPTVQTLHVIPEGVGLDATFTVKPDAPIEGLCQVEVTIAVQDHFGDFSGTQVTLLWDDTARSGVTNALGEVTFAGLPCAALTAMELLVVLPE